MPLNESGSNTTVQYTITTTNTADGTVLYWKTTGNTTNSDIVNGNTGTITITNNRALLNVTMVADFNTDNTKTLGISISTGSLTGPVAVNTATLITVNDTSQTPVGKTIEYLSVAGGGSGADNYGGGGGGGGVLNGSQTFFTGYTYTITIGAGGTTSYPGVPGVSYVATKGSNTSIIGTQSPALSIVSFGGGNGAGNGVGANFGQQGGSGGGGGYPQQAGTLAIGSPGIGVAGTQGYPGAPYQGVFNGGGGGGGGAAGSGQDGGNGFYWPITGEFYSGGGGGGTASPPSQWGGSGGAGGGGYGKNTSGAGPQPNVGVVNTGGGGGGGVNLFVPTGNYPGAGGSGVVVLAMPTPQYPGSAPGATVTTPPSAPGKTVLIYTSSGTFTP